MNWLRNWVPLALALAVAGAAGAANGYASPPLPTVEAVDPQRYSGTWYEIARLPNIFQRNCRSSTAYYRANPDGSITVVNSCVTYAGRCRRVEGRALPVPCSGGGRLRVSFGGLSSLIPSSPQGNYWIISLDPDYQWAMVGTPDRRYLWILSRSPQLDPEVYYSLINYASSLGFQVARLIR